MNPIVRAAPPLCLSDKRRFIKKCRKWQERYSTNPESQFAWGRYRKQNMGALIIEALIPMTQSHCSFCDINKVIKGGIRPTIEHFVPKTLKPLLAYVWKNLFLCCDQCQEYKNDLYHKALIKPDMASYKFDEYFIIDFATGELHPNPTFPQNVMAAQQTILLYGLNKDSRPQLRLDEVTAYDNTVPAAQILDNFSYRFFISRS
jgi:uncharacterized protein (TIGR02646 family)